MNIKHKIALIFTGLTAIVIVLMGVVIYGFALNYSTEKFFQRLDQRAVIAAKANFDEDQLDAQIYREIRFKYLHTLPDEKEYIYKIPVKSADIEASAPFSGDFIQRAVNQGKAYFRKNNLYGTAIRYVDNTGTYIVAITAKDVHGFNKLFHLRRTIIITILVSLILVYTLGYFYSLQVLKPINNIINEVKQIKASNLDRRLQVKKSHKNDELGALAKTYNDMLSRLETSFAIQNRFVNHASHEFKNPLTAILGKIEVVLSRKGRTEEEYLSALHSIKQEANKLKDITLNLLQLSKISNGPQDLEMKPVRVDEVLFEIRNNYSEKISNGYIKLHFANMPDNPEQFMVKGNHNLLQIAFSNLVENGIKFSDPPAIDITISTNNNFITVKFTDQGIGIPENEQEVIFETFHRGKNTGKSPGHGIGLPLTWNIVQIHDGYISVNSREHEGTTFTITLPVYNSSGTD